MLVTEAASTLLLGLQVGKVLLGAAWRPAWLAGVAALPGST